VVGLEMDMHKEKKKKKPKTKTPKTITVVPEKLLNGGGVNTAQRRRSSARHTADVHRNRTVPCSVRGATPDGLAQIHRNATRAARGGVFFLVRVRFEKKKKK
jgi:hypothetical protein